MKLKGLVKTVQVYIFFFLKSLNPHHNILHVYEIFMNMELYITKYTPMINLMTLTFHFGKTR